MDELSVLLDRATALAGSVDTPLARLLLLSSVERDRALLERWRAAFTLCNPRAFGGPGAATAVRMLPVVTRERVLFEQVESARRWWSALLDEATTA